MKRICIGLLLPALMLIASCSTLQYDTGISELDKIGVVTVQCRNDNSIKTLVEHILKAVRVSEWKIEKETGEMEIEARYNDITDQKLREIEQQLNETPGVMHVDIRRDRIPPRGAF